MKIIKIRPIFQHRFFSHKEVTIECDCKETFATYLIFDNDKTYFKYKYCPYCAKAIDVGEIFNDG